jgi:hypothetical protein
LKYATPGVGEVRFGGGALTDGGASPQHPVDGAVELLEDERLLEHLVGAQHAAFARDVRADPHRFRDAGA